MENNKFSVIYKFIYKRFVSLQYEGPVLYDRYPIKQFIITEIYYLSD